MKILILIATLTLTASLSQAQENPERIKCNSAGFSFEATIYEGANQTYLENVKVKENNAAVNCSTCGGVYLLQGSNILVIHLDAPDQVNRTVVAIKKNKETKSLEYYSNDKYVGTATCEGLF